jgi:HD-GYP domain-containing protein (c-di-GMP phosphodiesterase class II)
MEVGECVYGAKGQLLLRPGVRLTDTYIARLREQGTPAIYIGHPDTIDVIAPQPVSHEARAEARQALAEVFDCFDPANPELKKLSIALVQEHAGSERFAQAVRSAFGAHGMDGIQTSVDTLLEDLLDQTVLAGLNSIKTHDGYTYQHSIDVTIMGVIMARRAGWDSTRVREFGIGCMLHDLGKVMIPAEILNKPGKLTDAEFEQMKAHPVVGYHMVKAICPMMSSLVAHVAYQHHERQDGSGYPRKLAGSNRLGENAAGKIHDFGALCAVADVYDAMSSNSNRPYRVGWSPEKVVATIASMSGTHLNKEAVDLFLSVVTPYPVCSEVIVVNGKYAAFSGIVKSVSPEKLARPVIRILRNPAGERVEPFDLDLGVELDVIIRAMQAEEPKTESMGGRRKETRPPEPLPPEVERALEKVRNLPPPKSKTKPATRRPQRNDGDAPRSKVA